MRFLPLLAVLALVGCGASKHRETSTTPASANTGCAGVQAPAPQMRHRKPPTAKLDPAKTYTVTLGTNCGSFSIRLAVKTSPKTTASFVSLVRSRFFDGTVFHRIVPGFVIQGGDPTATGSGGPGYLTVDRPPEKTHYTFGLVAMAKTQAQPAGTSGSQFFVVTAADAGLPPDYAVLGEVVSGLPTVRRIGKLGDPTTERPTELVEIERATVAAR
jgi:cyclophilin family peptidyl-prolyl cis-trans isomerase